jgi:hypothetical protein
VVAGEFHNLGLTHEGEVVAWGDLRSTRGITPLLPGRVLSIACSTECYALLEGGVLCAWGGQYGDGYYFILRADIAWITAGGQNVWGIDWLGKVYKLLPFQGSAIPFDTPSSVIKISASATRALAVLDDGQLHVLEAKFCPGEWNEKPGIVIDVACCKGTDYAVGSCGKLFYRGLAYGIEGTQQHIRGLANISARGRHAAALSRETA